MINEKRMERFEAVYADMHDVLPDTVKMHRFQSEDSYSLPGLAHDYRMYCASIASVFVRRPESCEFAELNGPYHRGYRQGVRVMVDAVESANLRVL